MITGTATEHGSQSRPRRRNAILHVNIAICGYYFEFEEPDGENPVKFGHQITLDMDRFRDFCQSADQPAG